jgi:glycosyltransferase involved in cell wall biosynthesis
LKYFSHKKEFETHFITNGGDSLDRLKELPNFKIELLNFTTGYKNIFYKISFYKSLKDYVIRNKIDLIHTHHRFPEMVSVSLARELKIKTVTSAHSFVTGFRHSSFKSDRLISVSNSISDYLVRNYAIAEENIITLHNPMDEDSQIDLKAVEKLKAKNNISSDQKVLLFVGRINKDKGFDTLLKSFTQVSEKTKDVILLINGQVEDNRLKLKSILNNNNLFFVPPQKENLYLYSVADIVVLPSRIDPLPFVMIEAGSFKKPFIGGNTGGIAEFIEDGKNGLLVDPENPEQLAEKIIFLLNNPGTGKSLGENLYEKVNRLCNYNNYFTEVEKIYNSLIL